MPHHRAPNSRTASRVSHDGQANAGLDVDYIVINGAPILVATAVGLAISALYHALNGVRGNGRRLGVAWLLVIAVVAEFWLASILAGALILAPQQADPWVMAIGSAVVIWIGFVVPTSILTEVFRGVPLWRAGLDCGLWLAVMVAQAAVLHGMGLVKPLP
jgi:hypothetical protein